MNVYTNLFIFLFFIMVPTFSSNVRYPTTDINFCKVQRVSSGDIIRTCRMIYDPINNKFVYICEDN